MSLSGYRKSLFIWSLCGLTGLVVFVAFFYQAFPFASIDAAVNKEQAVKISADFIAAKGFDLRGFDQTVIFESDFYSSAYLQKTRGVKKISEYIQQGVPVWFFRVKWFRELDKESFTVDIEPSTGKVAHFKHSILDNKEGASLTHEQARQLAEQHLGFEGIDLEDYFLVENELEKQKNRIDHTLAWEKKGFSIDDARLRVKVRVFGDTLGEFTRKLKVPEEFDRSVQGEINLGRLLYRCTDIVKALMLIAAIILVAVHRRFPTINWKLWLTAAVVVSGLYLCNALNHLPFIWSSYDDTVSKTVYLSAALQERFLRMLSLGLMVFAYGALGEFLLREYGLAAKARFPLFPERPLKTHERITGVWVGYCLGFIFLGYATLFYLFGTRFLGVWLFPNTEYSNILGTSMPFLFPLTFSLIAAIDEEFSFRFFAIPLLTRLTRRVWLAVIIAALLWGYAHCFYLVFPMYVRGVELTLFGILLGAAFLRYGIVTVIVAHYVIDAVLAGLPLLQARNPYFVVSGYAVIACALIPLIAASIFSRRASISQEQAINYSI